MTTDLQASRKSPSAAAGSAASLSRQFRKWHSVLGAFAAIFLVVIGLTGIFLNHKPFFNQVLTGESSKTHEVESLRKRDRHSRAELRLGNGIASLPISFDRALNLAAGRWGHQCVEKIELKDEKGELLYKIKQPDGPELLISALTGEIIERGHYEKLGALGKDGKRPRSFDWGKLMLDLHTGKIVGESGRYVSTAISCVMLLLTLTGIYLWVKPKLRTRTARVAPKLSASRSAPALAASHSTISSLT